MGSRWKRVKLILINNKKHTGSVIILHHGARMDKFEGMFREVRVLGEGPTYGAQFRVGRREGKVQSMGG